jgi:tetratricopeptide (TPR) repeat protein
MDMPSPAKLIIAVFSLFLLPGQVHALAPDQVFDKVKDSVVVVKTLDAKGKVKSQGSGVLLPSGKIATNCHVVEGGAIYQVGRDKQLVSATLYAQDGDKDICLLSAKGLTGKPAQLGKASDLKVGVPVYAVGAPKGLELSLSDGIVSQLRGGPPPFIQTTAAISPGSSGGGLFDSEGKLVGLTTLYIEGGQSLNFAMPVEWVAEVKPESRQVAGRRSETKWLTRAIALEESKDWKGMLDWCRKWVKSEPENDLAWYSLGVSYRKLERYNDAIAAYRQALRINPEHVYAWDGLGAAYDKLERYNDAIAAFQNALRINPEHAKAWYNLGVTYHELERYNDAMDTFRNALGINPKYADAWYNLGVNYANLKCYDDAIDAFRQALRINPEDANAWYNLGVAYGDLERYNDAIAAYRQALRINPELASAWNNLGITYGRLKRYDDAIDANRQALRINPEYAFAWKNLGIAYALSGNRSAALGVVKELRRLDPAKADELFNLIVPR